MILPLMNVMSLKTTTSAKTAPRTGPAAGPGGKKARLSAIRTGLMLIGLLAVAAATFRIARRRSR